MKPNKLLTISLCAGLLFSSFGTLSLSYANEAVQLISDTFFGQPVTSSTSVETPSTPIEPPPKHYFTTDSPVELQEEEGPAKNKTAKATRMQTQNEAAEVTTPQDKYNFSGDDLMQLLSEGYLFDDIVKADDLGNRLDKDPRKLLEELKVGKKEWTQIENELRTERYGADVARLKAKYPEAAAELEKEQFGIQGELALLTVFDGHRVPSMQEAIRRYKQDKERAIDAIYEENQFFGHVSEELRQKYELTDAMIKQYRFTDEVIHQIEQQQDKPGSGSSAKQFFLELKQHAMVEPSPNAKEEN